MHNCRLNKMVTHQQTLSTVVNWKKVMAFGFISQWSSFLAALFSLIHCGLVTHMVSDILVNIRSGKGASPVRRKYIIRTNVCHTVTQSFSNKRQWNLYYKTNILTEESTIQNIVCKMVVILFCAQWFKTLLVEANFCDKTSYIDVYMQPLMLF